MSRRLVLALSTLCLFALLGAAGAAVAAPPHIELGVDPLGRTVATVGPGPNKRTGILRLDASGGLDRSFAGDGTIGPFASKSPAAMGLARNGDVVVALEPRPGKSFLRRYRAADGTPDPSFGKKGSVPIPIVPANRVLVQPDGHVIVLYEEICPSSNCGYLLTYLKFNRFSPRGRFEDFHTRYQEEWEFEAVAMDSRGSFLVKGSDEEIGWQTFAKFKPSGKLDPSVGGKEGVNISPPSASEEEGGPVEPGPKRELIPASSHIAIAPDGGILMAAKSWNGEEAVIQRRLKTGYIDPAFGVAGEAICKPAGEVVRSEPFDALTVAPDGSVLAAGGLGPCGLVRFTPTGQPDPTFGTEGRVDLEALGLPRASVIALAPDGDIVVGGWSPATKSAVFARFTPEGRLDRTFGTAGVTSVGGF